MAQKVRLLISGGFAPSGAVLNLFEPHGFSWRRSPRRWRPAGPIVQLTAGS